MHRGKDNIQMSLRKIGCEDVNWTEVVQDRV